MADVVFILGAGCSVHCNAPVMSNFLDRARELRALGQVQNREDEFDFAFRVISDLALVHSKSQFNINNIESIFAAVDLGRVIQRLPGMATAADVERARSALIWLIVRTIEESIEFPTDGGYTRGTDQYGALAALIRDLGVRKPKLSVAIITFNYDVAAEITFVNSNVQFTYGFSGTESGVPLLKLHGSLNWFRFPGEAEIHAFPMLRLVNLTRTKWHSGDSNPTRRLPVSAYSLEMLRNQLGAGLDEVPVIVPPTWSKGEHHREITAVWARAAKELSDARYIYAMGYSLPETDQFFRLLYALGTAGPANLADFSVFDPNIGEVDQRFRSMLGPAALDRFHPYPFRFDGAIQTVRSRLIPGT